MSFMSRIFGNKYNDKELLAHAENAIAIDPMVKDSSRVSITASKGVVTLSGKVSSEREKNRVEGVVRASLKSVGLEFASLKNETTIVK